MPHSRKTVLLVTGAILAVSVIALLLVGVFFNVNTYKPRIEAAVASAIGMDVRIGGAMHLRLLPQFEVSLDDVHISRHGSAIAAAQRIDVGIELLSLLHQDFRIDRMALDHAVITVERDRDGHFNIEPAPARDTASTQPLPALDITVMTLENTTLSYTDRTSDMQFTLESCGLDAKHFQLRSDARSEFPDRLSFIAQLTCKIFQRGNLRIEDLHLGIAADAGRYHIDGASAARLVYSGADGAVTATQMKASARQLDFSKAERDLSNRLELFGNITVETIQTRNLLMSDVQAAIVGKAGRFDFDPLAMDIYAGQAAGKLRADFSAAVPVYHLTGTLSKFRIEDFTKSFAGAKRATGAMDLAADLSLQGNTANELRRSAAGTVSLHGTDIDLHGIDLDQQLAEFESSQSFNLVDAGALFFAGPFGPALTKGYSFASLLHGGDGNSRVHILKSDWKVDHGVASARDVALATAKHRLALKGQLDFVRLRYNDVTVALIDTQGCAMAQQKIHGPFSKPQVDKINVLTSLSAPVVKLFKQTLNWVTGKHCEVFYAGSVQPPS